MNPDVAAGLGADVGRGAEGGSVPAQFSVGRITGCGAAEGTDVPVPTLGADAGVESGTVIGLSDG